MKQQLTTLSLKINCKSHDIYVSLNVEMTPRLLSFVRVLFKEILNCAKLRIGHCLEELRDRPARRCKSLDIKLFIYPCHVNNWENSVHTWGLSDNYVILNFYIGSFVWGDDEVLVVWVHHSARLSGLWVNFEFVLSKGMALKLYMAGIYLFQCAFCMPNVFPDLK